MSSSIERGKSAGIYVYYCFWETSLYKLHRVFLPCPKFGEEREVENCLIFCKRLFGASVTFRWAFGEAGEWEVISNPCLYHIVIILMFCNFLFQEIFWKIKMAQKYELFSLWFFLAFIFNNNLNVLLILNCLQVSKIFFRVQGVISSIFCSIKISTFLVLCLFSFNFSILIDLILLILRIFLIVFCLFYHLLS